MMAATFAQEGRTVVRLSEIPVELRQTVAHELARSWKLKGFEYALFLLRATDPVGDSDVLLLVPAAKVALVMSGQRPAGQTPEEALSPPVLIA